jgi:hypothetical protein
MLNLISKLNAKQSATIAKGTAKLARKLGCTVRQDRGGYNRYFIQAGADHYIISARDILHRKVEKKDGDTFRQYHAGFLSLYKEHSNTNRNLWDVPQRDTEISKEDLAIKKDQDSILYNKGA